MQRTKTRLSRRSRTYIFSVKKLRHSLLAHQTLLISKVDLIKYVMTRSALSGNLAKQIGSLTNGALYPICPTKSDPRTSPS